MLELESLNGVFAAPTALTVAYALLVSFVLSAALAFCYEKTFQGLSYSRNFVQCLILAPLAVCMAMQAVGDSLARGVGMMGALALIRFRSSIRDPRDMIFIFSSLAIGMATGVHAYMVAFIGTLAICSVSVLLYRSPFIDKRFFDGILRFHLQNEAGERQALEQILSKHCRQFALISSREMAQGQSMEHAYHIKLRSTQQREKILSDLSALKSIRGLTLMAQEPSLSV